MELYKLSKLSSVTELQNSTENKDITGITESSTKVKAGYLFIAVKGHEVDGHDFIEEAVERGAAVVIGEYPAEQISVPYIQVDNSRKVLGQLAAAFYGFPSRDKLVIGVTGTNGKTTTSLFIQHLLKKIGYRVSYFGTIFNEVNGVRTKSALTTPPSCFIQEQLSQSDDEAVVIEVSSQGLAQHRMEGLEFDYALFMNLQHDHLDYHNTMEDYFYSKKRLFSYLKSNGKAIVYTDDDWGMKLKNLLEQEGQEVLTVGSKNNANIQIDEILKTNGMISIEQDTYKVKSPLPGTYNVINTIMAGSVVYDMGKSFDQVNDWIQDIEQIAGRFESYLIKDEVYSVVDYAHTAEAVDLLLKTVREIYPKYHLIHIFGFRGNRDITKRNKMIEVSSKRSDKTILTLDDLNKVPEEEMKEEYKKYLDKSIVVEMDRTRAVYKAAAAAAGPTIIVVTGKGHETYQQHFELGTATDTETVKLIRKQLKNEEYC
ncbi:hypothetical protein BKP56_01470 [Marinilactibacillus sp. 15R]|uniref:UDP-N-acetylmuramoylalanyl-D-glutamate--2,6-diaminopimelate ligase n=1 Tax=Marinilactibacillus piezotolerans TaxID=258723 RepID=A0A1I3XPL3_9LACT|nr:MULTISPECIES: UDP-N-acetylmuramoyl-L-alanyl-D-glutamate--2,6-diaminopimelate ligase [Marinilactibacillus]API88076.1 hypothetical protein BKP56_01470 [Marinilactibacillus sp. 15R]SFK21597.1 UDP-N-acetylmuramoylalanyl-D-glutamate--2,6-diaminopimelate ligase [Marinilactibacillus piezotolerans]